MIGRLRSDDIYNQISTYQLPEHRSTALSNQAAMLYICLFFAPDILHNQATKMREIVDKFFPDNWVISIYMGITVNLINSWKPYKAAKTALNNTLIVTNIKEISTIHGKKLIELIDDTKSVLMEGALPEELLTNKVNKVIALIRDCNVTLRWVMLHLSKQCLVFEIEQLKPLSQVTPHKIFELLLNLSQLELKVKDMFKKLLDTKEEKWKFYQKECIERINELSEVFSGEKPLTRIEKNVNLQVWFRDIAKHIQELEQTDGRKIVHLIQALEEVQEFHQLDSQMHVKQFLEDVRKFLHQMIRTINIKEDVLITLQIICDISYAWNIIDGFTEIMQNGKEQRLAQPSIPSSY